MSHKNSKKGSHKKHCRGRMKSFPLLNRNLVQIIFGKLKHAVTQKTEYFETQNKVQSFFVIKCIGDSKVTSRSGTRV